MAENKEEEKGLEAPTSTELVIETPDDGVSIENKSFPFLVFAAPSLVRVRAKLIDHEEKPKVVSPEELDVKAMAAEMLGDLGCLKIK